MKKILSILIAVAVLAVGGYYAYKYFLDPKGISLAAAELCIINGTEGGYVFVGETIPGAKIIQLLDGGEGFCVPAPQENVSGKIAVGPTEDELVCEYSTEQIGPAIRLEKYDTAGNCTWAE